MVEIEGSLAGYSIVPLNWLNRTKHCLFFCVNRFGSFQIHLCYLGGPLTFE